MMLMVLMLMLMLFRGGGGGRGGGVPQYLWWAEGGNRKDGVDHVKLDVRLTSRNGTNLAVITIRPRQTPLSCTLAVGIN